MKLPIAAVVLTALSFPTAAYADGDAAAGKRVFMQCAVCHSPQPDKTILGPSLFGVVGRHSASLEGYSYSEAMKAADKTWDAATLDAYLTKPQAMVPGTKMTFAGLAKAEDRANVIAYLETLK